MYEHVRGNLKKNIILNLIKWETYLPLLKLTQLKAYSRILKTTQTHSTQKYSRISHSTQRLDVQHKDYTQLKDMIFDSGSTQCNARISMLYVESFIKD